MKPSPLVLLAVVLVVATGCASAQAPDPVAQGRAQFVAQGCHGCHTIGQLGTPIAPDLSHVGARYSQAWLVRWLRDPSAHVADARMPTLELSEEQVEALAAYLSSLR
jgi:mono/diheme cytochrome c family protein